MTSILSPAGKYRPRKDWSTHSIPISVEEEESINPVIIINNGLALPDEYDLLSEVTANNKNNVNVKVPVKPPRRSSLAISIFTSRNNSDKTNKRRSSIAVTFLGRKESKSGLNAEKKSSKVLESTLEDQVQSTIGLSDNYDKDKKRRRSSWQAKLDRRRRKQGIFTAADIKGNAATDVEMIPNGEVEFNQQKRHSWWNIFVPDNLKSRSRRSSSEIGILARSADNLPYRRSKSRSVDHGLATPFDLDSLRSKVEGRFESIDRLTNKENEKKKKAAPIPTITYTVGDRDTLTSVAARFDTTPSELTQLNRLGSSFIYPGQQLQVPDKSKKLDIDDANSDASSELSEYKRKNSNDDIPLEEKELLEGLRPSTPRPGHIERIISPNTQSTTIVGTDETEDQILVQRFLKINVRHITDGQGVVAGVLLVTPNAVMFDPNVSDPLVIEHGPESYGVIAPMEFIVNAAIFNDIAHMRVGGSIEQISNEKPEIYFPKTSSRCDTHSPGKDSLVKDETFPELGVGSVEVCDDQESICSSNERDGAAFPKAFERDLITPNELRGIEDSVESEGEKSLSIEASDTKDGKKTDTKAGSGEQKSHFSKSQTEALEERRSSLLDQHWAIPSKDRRKSSCNDKTSKRSTDEEDEPDGVLKEESTHKSNDGGNLVSIEASNITNPDDTNSILKMISADDTVSDPIVPVIPAKKIYSDADIVLSKDWVPPLTIAPSHITETPNRSLSVTSQHTLGQSQTTDSGRKKTSSVSFSIDDNTDPTNVVNNDKNSEKKNKMLKRLSYPLAWVEGLTSENKSQETSESAPNTGDSNQSVFSKVFSSSPITLVSELGGNLFLSKTPSEESGGSPIPPLTPHSGDGSAGSSSVSSGATQNTAGRSSIGTFMRSHPVNQSDDRSQKQKHPPQPKLDYRSMVSIDDMPALFVSFDKLIPRPARACPDPPMYLRLRMGRQIGKTTPLPTTVMSYGKNKLRPEYWFSIPKNKVDELYRFFGSWVSHLYGELDEEAIRSRGFELIQHDTEWASKGSPSKDGRGMDDTEIKELTRESWEVLSMSTDDYRKAALFAPGSFDQDFPIPELIGQTEILSEEHREKLCSHLPARAEGYAWSLVFSTSLHGFSLNSLYRKMHKLESPVLIVIQDTENNVFGALTSCSLHVSDHFYGTGESLLYKFNPTFKVFHWSGENLYFIKGNPESLAIGAGDGKFGLWLDGDLNQGRSQYCSTYSNEPLAPQEDFVIKTLECWAFV